jgi:hypothetical protein
MLSSWHTACTVRPLYHAEGRARVVSLHAGGFEAFNVSEHYPFPEAI